MRLPVLLAAVCCAGAMNAAPPAYQNLPTNTPAQKIITTPDGGFLVLAGLEVLRFSPDGVLISTWTAPTSKGIINDLTLDAQGNLYVAGTSTANDIPITNSSVPAGSGSQSFFMKLDTTYSKVLVSARFGDSSTNATAIAVDPNGNIYLGGSTLAAAFPNAFNPSPPPVAGVVSTYAFAIKIPQTADGITYSVLLGGPAASCSNDFEGHCPGQLGDAGSTIAAFSAAAALAVDASGSVTIAGATFSYGFPVTPGVVGPTSAGEDFGAIGEFMQSGFVTKLDPTGSSMVYSTCFGTAFNGVGGGVISVVRLAPDGNAVVAGSALNTTVPIPVGGNILAGGFLAKLNATATAVIFGLPLADSVNDFSIDSEGNIWLTGMAAGIVEPNSVAGAFIAEAPPDGSGIVAFNQFTAVPWGVSISVAGNGVLALGPGEVVYETIPAPTSAISGGAFNAISQQPELSVAPGEFVTVYGSNLGGATVDFYGVSAPLLYDGSSQINVIAPWSLKGPMNIWQNGTLVKSIPLGVAVANLQLLALVNADGTINSLTNPASAGSTVTAFINGASYVNSSLPVGAISGAGTMPLSPALSVSPGLTITYQGWAPGELNEVQQVNLLIGALPANSQATLSQGSSTLKFNIAVSPAK